MAWHWNYKYLSVAVDDDLKITAVSTRISCRWQNRATRCITANVQQTNKVDAQYDKFVMIMEIMETVGSILLAHPVGYLSYELNFKPRHKLV